MLSARLCTCFSLLVTACPGPTLDRLAMAWWRSGNPASAVEMSSTGTTCCTLSDLDAYVVRSQQFYRLAMHVSYP